MKRIAFTLFAAGTLMLSGCFETVQEITLHEDGSGTVNNTDDMSSLLAMVKQMGGGADLEKMGDQKLDTSFSLADKVDSIPNLTAEEKMMMMKGTLNFKMNMKDERFTTSILFPFTFPSEILTYNHLSVKIMSESMKKEMGGSGMPMGNDMPERSSFDDYFTMVYSNGVMEKKLNKEKYANAGNDEYLKNIKEAAGMGVPMTATYIINLPRPAKKAEGKNVKLSDDKKQVTVKADIDDFFDDPSKLEFRIEY